MLAGFIPARSGSKRIPQKNIRPFFGHPLLAYAIQGAFDAGIFDAGIYVSSDSEEVGAIARHYGASFIRRPEEFALDTSPDAEWLLHALEGVKVPRFAILRPTAPFRTGETILRAYSEWDKRSLMKAIEPVSQHPGKMWFMQTLDERRMCPLWPGGGHLCQTNTLMKLYVQNASLEFRVNGHMETYQPFLTRDWEGFDLNTPEDWLLAEVLVSRGIVHPPTIERGPYPSTI